MGMDVVGRVTGRWVVMGKAVGRRKVARRAAVVGLEVNKAEAVAVPRAREAAMGVRVDAVMVRARAVPRMTTKVVLVAVAEVGVGRKLPRT